MSGLFSSGDHVHGQLLAAQAHGHNLASEIRMVRKVADASDGDFGIVGLDGHTAAVRMDHRHHVIDVGIFRQDFPPDLVHCVAYYSGHALDACDDSQDVPASCRQTGSVVEPHPCPSFGKLRRNPAFGTFDKVGHRGRRRKLQVELVDPASGFDVLLHVTEDGSVPHDLLALFDGPEGYLVPLRDVAEGLDGGSLENLTFRCGGNHHRYVVQIRNPDRSHIPSCYFSMVTPLTFS